MTSAVFGQGNGAPSCLPGALQKPSGSSHAVMGRAGQTCPQPARLGLGTRAPGTPTKPAAEEQVLLRFSGPEGFPNNTSTTAHSFAHSPGGSYVYQQSCLAWWGCKGQCLTCVKAELGACKDLLLQNAQRWGPLWVLEFCKKRGLREIMLFFPAVDKTCRISTEQLLWKSMKALQPVSSTWREINAFFPLRQRSSGTWRKVYAPLERWQNPVH